MKLDELMVRFQAELGLDRPLPRGETGGYRLPLNPDQQEKSVMEVVDLSPGIGLYCNVVACPKVKQGELYTRMMLANLFGQGTDGAILGLSQNGAALTLSREIQYNVDYEKFSEIVEDFISAVEFWNSEVDELIA